MKRNVYLIPVLTVVIIAVITAACLVTDNGNKNTEEKSTTIEMGVASDGDQKTLMLSASADKFNTSTASGAVTVYYFPLDGYIDENKSFDYTTFYKDMQKQGAYNEKIGDYLPSNAKAVTDFNLGVTSGTSMTIGFTAEGEYDAYVVVLGNGAVTDKQPVALSLYDIPASTLTVPTPVLSVMNAVYENLNNYDFSVRATNTTFNESVDESCVSLSGQFSDLTVVSVEYVSDDIVVVHTSGVVTRGTSATGYIDFDEDALACGYALSATVPIKNNTFGVDETTFKISDGKLLFDVVMSSCTYSCYKQIDLCGTTYQISDVPYTEADDTVRLHFSIDATASTVSGCLKGIEDYSVLFYDGSIEDLAYTLSIPGAVVYGYVEEASVSDSLLVLTIPVSAISGSVTGLTSDMVEVSCDYPDTTVTVNSNQDGYVLTVTVPGFGSDCFSGSITISDGVLTPWGEDTGETTFQVSTVVANVPTTDALIQELYSNMQFTNVCGYIQLGVYGIQGVVNVLEMTGAVEMSSASATEMKIAEISLKCDEIKHMLENQAVMLGKINQKLDNIIQLLQDQRLRDLSSKYSEFVQKSNNMSNAVSALSMSIKMDVAGLTQDVENDAIYIYVTEKGELSVMHGNIYKRYSDGMAIDGKNIIPEYTICIKLNNGSTFKDARTAMFEEKTTESKMVDCLKKYIDDNDVRKSFTLQDGTVKSYTTAELAQKIYDCIVVKYAEVAVKDNGLAKTILDAYESYAECMASLKVIGDKVYVDKLTLKANPTLISQELVENGYNFESEVLELLKNMNNCNALSLYSYTQTVINVLQLMGAKDTLIKNYYSTSIGFLKEYKGYHQDAYESETYCYVTSSFLSSSLVTIKQEATYHSDNGFSSNVDDQPTNITSVQSSGELGIPAKYMDTEQFNKLLANFNRIAPTNDENVKLTLADYLRIHANLRDLSDDLITSFTGGRYYDDGDHVWLYSHINLVSPGHSAQLVDSGSMYQIVDPVDTSGFMGQYKAHSYDVYGKVIYMGDLFNISSGKYYDSVCGVKGCIYAVGFFCKHVSTWSNDEAAILTPEKSLSSCSVNWNRGYGSWQIWVQASYSMLKIC